MKDFEKPIASTNRVNLAKINDGGVTKLVHVEQNQSPNVELIYCSKAIATLSNEDLGAIINIANRESRTHGISSVLCFAHGHFIQLLEGEGAAINSLYCEISKKTQRDRIQLISFKVAEANSFANQYLAHQGDSKIVCYDKGEEFSPQRFNHQQAIEFLSGVLNVSHYQYQNAELRLRPT